MFKSLKKIVVLLCVLFFNDYVFCQDSYVDSLKHALNNAKHDTVKCQIISDLMQSVSENEWPIYTEKLKNLAELNLKSCPQNNPLYKVYLKYLANAMFGFGDINQLHGNYADALKFYFKSLAIDEKIGNKSNIASSLNSIGGMYDYQGNISKALEYYTKSLKIREELKDKKQIAILLDNIGAVHDNQGDTAKALELYFKALKINREIGDKEGEATALNNIGFVYSNHNQQDKALNYYEKSLEIQHDLNNKKGIAHMLGNIGGIYFTKNELIKSKSYLEQSIKMYEELNDKSNISHGYNNLARILLKEKNYTKALTYSSKSLAMSREIGYPELIRNASQTLSNIYEKTNNYQEALKNYELYVLMRDSILNLETKKTAIKSQLKYEYEKQAAADSVKHNEEQKVKNAQLQAQAAKLKQEKIQRYALYGGLLLVIGFSVFVFNRFKMTQKQKRIIEEQKVLVDEAYSRLHEKNKEVMDSIYYARRIQRALLTSELYIDRVLDKLNKKN